MRITDNQKRFVAVSSGTGTTRNVRIEAEKADAFSAKGASLFQPGATPQEACRLESAALTARFIVGGRWSIARTMGRAFSPDSCDFAFSWGVAPGWNDAAPLALNRYGLQPVPPKQIFQTGSKDHLTD